MAVLLPTGTGHCTLARTTTSFALPTYGNAEWRSSVESEGE
jgi:hypothetical protein